MIHQKKLYEIAANMGEKSKQCIDVIHETGTSNWLSVLPIKEYNYVLNKQKFREKLRLRYDWPISDF